MIALAWKPVTESLPDDDTLVLIALNDDDVWTGFRDGGIWRYADAMPITSERVTHWMHMPAAPALPACADLPSSPMKLQLKDAGAWRDVARFDGQREREVQQAGALLMRCATNPKAVLRTVEGDQVRAYCESPFHDWRPA